MATPYPKIYLGVWKERNNSVHLWHRVEASPLPSPHVPLGTCWLTTALLTDSGPCSLGQSVVLTAICCWGVWLSNLYFGFSGLELHTGLTVAPDNNIDLLGSCYPPCLPPCASPLIAFSIGTLHSIILHSTHRPDCELLGLLQTTSDPIFQSIGRANVRALLPWASPSNQLCFNEPHPRLALLQDYGEVDGLFIL